MVSVPRVASKPVADCVTCAAPGVGNVWPGIWATALADAVKARAARKVRVESMYFSSRVGGRMRAISYSLAIARRKTETVPGGRQDESRLAREKEELRTNGSQRRALLRSAVLRLASKPRP